MALCLSASLGGTQEPAFFRIGTSSTGGTYFPIGGLIASVISNPPGSLSCENGGSCGVPGLIAIAQSTRGSVDNIDAIAEGTLESGLTQADIAYWGYHGEGIYLAKGKVANLRAIANLYPESLQIVVRADSDIHNVADLKGRVVSIGEEGSGTLVDAKIVLGAYGLSRTDIEHNHFKPGPASDLMRAGRLEAIFLVAGYPADAITELAEGLGIRLLAIDGAEATRIRLAHPFFTTTVVPEGAYPGVAATTTLSVGAQWVVSADVDEDLVYGITRALWHESTRPVLDNGHPEGRLIRLATALDGVAIPLHPGAARYYREVGLVD